MKEAELVKRARAHGIAVAICSDLPVEAAGCSSLMGVQVIVAGSVEAADRELVEVIAGRARKAG